MGLVSSLAPQDAGDVLSRRLVPLSCLHVFALLDWKVLACIVWNSPGGLIARVKCIRAPQRCMKGDLSRDSVQCDFCFVDRSKDRNL